MSSAPAPCSELTTACAPASAAATTTTTMEKKKKITLKSFDNELFEVDEEVLLISQTIKNLIEDGCADTVIPLPNVNSKTLGKIIEYCKKHTNTHSDHSSESKPESSSSSPSPSAADSIQTWDAKFMQISTDDLYDVLLASNYLDIAPLLDLACQTTADLIKGKSTEEIRKTFNIKNDFMPEEEAEIKKANQWAFEGI